MVVGGVLIALLGGFFNATWNIFAKESAPEPMRVVGCWRWEHCWLVFNVWSALVNIAFLFAVWPAGALHSVVQGADAGVVVMVIVFSLIWGFGSYGYGLGIKMLGAALGTGISITTTLIVGTLLPLLVLYPGDIGSASGLLTLFGCAIAVAGVVLGARASILRDRLSGGDGARGHAMEEYKEAVDGAMEELRAGALPDVTLSVELTQRASGRLPASEQAAEAAGKGGGDSDAEPVRIEVLGRAIMLSRSFAGVITALIAGSVSALLQFAFVFGLPMVDAAEDDHGVDPVLSSGVVWLFAFSLAAIPNIAICLSIMRSEGSFGRFAEGGWRLQAGNVAKTFVMAIIFDSHIHGYGVGQFMLGDMGPAIMWPLLMSSTMLFGQLWGFYLREWAGVHESAVRVNQVSIVVICCSIAVLATASATGGGRGDDNDDD